MPKISNSSSQAVPSLCRFPISNAGFWTDSQGHLNSRAHFWLPAHECKQNWFKEGFQACFPKEPGKWLTSPPGEVSRETWSTAAWLQALPLLALAGTSCQLSPAGFSPLEEAIKGNRCKNHSSCLAARPIRADFIWVIYACSVTTSAFQGKTWVFRCSKRWKKFCGSGQSATERWFSVNFQENWFCICLLQWNAKFNYF